MNRWMKRLLGTMAVALGVGMSACKGPELPLPDAKEMASHYTYAGKLEASLNGNVAEITATQQASQLRRGGVLWAKVGPYIVLFSDDTRSLLEDYPGLAGVEVVTRTPSGTEVARALLKRKDMTDLLWRRSLNISGKARRDGTKRPTLLDELVRWGEDHTEYRYSPKFTSTG